MAESTPSWIAQLDDGYFYSEWGWFCDRIGMEFGGLVYWYELANEQNTVNHGSRDSIPIFNGCFTNLNNEETGPYTQNYPDHTAFFRSIVNAFTGFTCFSCDLSYWLTNAGSSIDVIAMDHYPGSNLYTNKDWGAMDTLSSYAIQYNKLAGIMETGKATDAFCDEGCQSQWILDNIRDGLRPKALAQNRDYYNNRYVLLAWYELYDDIGYGLIATDGHHKVAFSTFQSEATNYVLPPYYS